MGKRGAKKTMLAKQVLDDLNVPGKVSKKTQLTTDDMMRMIEETEAADLASSPTVFSGVPSVETQLLLKLRRQGVLTDQQVDEASQLAHQSGEKPQDVLVKLNYATQDQILSAVAEVHGLPSINLTQMTVPAAVVEMIPESVARENVVLPLAAESGTLRIAISDPLDRGTVEKLTFILNRDIQPVLASRDQIVEAINRHYGQTETVSVDSMLSEFPCTAIDFTESEKLSASQSTQDSNQALCLAGPSPMATPSIPSYREESDPRKAAENMLQALRGCPTTDPVHRLGLLRDWQDRLEWLHQQFVVSGEEQDWLTRFRRVLVSLTNLLSQRQPSAVEIHSLWAELEGVLEEHLPGPTGPRSEAFWK